MLGKIPLELIKLARSKTLRIRGSSGQEAILYPTIPFSHIYKNEHRTCILNYRICISSQNIAYKWSHVIYYKIIKHILKIIAYILQIIAHILQIIAHILQFIAYILHLLHTSNEYRTYVTIIAYIIWETSHIYCTYRIMQRLTRHTSHTTFRQPWRFTTSWYQFARLLRKKN